MCDIHLTMYMWEKYDKAIAAWLHRINTKRIHVPGRPQLLTLHHPPTLEAYTWPNKKSCSSKKWTQFDSLPSNLLHNIGMWHAGLVNHNKTNKSWIDSHNKIHFFVRPIPMKYNTSPLNTSCITTSSDTFWWKYALALTHPTMTANREI